jgi:hypothetical protein
MAPPIPPSVSVDVYPTTNVSSPTPGRVPAVAGLPGYLQPRVQTGRHAPALYLRWTHILYTNPGVDVRDAYNGQLNAWTSANADTVVLRDNVNKTLTAWIVVYVERALIGTPGHHYRVYLDRFQPQSWPSQAL